MYVHLFIYKSQNQGFVMSSGENEKRNMNVDVCEVECINPEAVAEAKSDLIGTGVATDLAELFKVMADPNRLRIISLLAQRELCVCDIAASLEMSQSAVSHQLRVLRIMQLVKFRKEGRAAYYSLDDEHVLKLFTQGLDHLGHTSPVRKKESSDARS